MADAPPPGPPPPKVPEGWKAVWNDQYKEWFYVNRYTKVSQWDKPTEPAVDPNHANAPDGPPPAYMPSSQHPSTNEKQNPNNPYNTHSPSNQDIDADARYAARLQAEENARAQGSRPTSSGAPTGQATRGAADSYYNSTNSPTSAGAASGGRYPHSPGPSSPPGYAPGAGPASSSGDAKRGFLSKIMGKSNQSQQYNNQYPPPQGGGYGRGAYPPQQGYPQQNYYGGGGYAPQGGYYGGPPQPQYIQQQPKKSFMSGGGGALLGAGAGLVGGALLMDAFEDHEQFEEQQAYQMGEDQGYDQGYDQGFDAGNDDMGGDF